MRPAPQLNDLLGLPWWGLGRARDSQWFHFGERRTSSSPTSSPREVGDYAVQVRAPWRVCVDGKIVLGSRDVTFPRGTSRLDEVPADFDWKRHPTRLDEVAEALQQQLLPRNVGRVHRESTGSVSITFEGDLSLEIFPDGATESESWRLLVPGDSDRQHLVEESSRHVALVPGVAPSFDPASRATCYTEAHASIRFMGDSLDPLDVTRLIRLPHDHAHRDGEPTIRRRRTDLSVNEYAPYRGGMWRMSSKPWVRSSDLNAHVCWLLEQLEGRAAQVKHLLSKGVVGDIFCFSSGAPANAPTLPDQTIARAAALGLTIDIDHYGSDEPADSTRAL